MASTKQMSDEIISMGNIFHIFDERIDINGTAVIPLDNEGKDVERMKGKIYCNVYDLFFIDLVVFEPFD